MFIRAIFSATAHVYWWLNSHAPSNRLINAARTRPGLRWAPITLVVAALCWLTAATLQAMIADGAPAWLNLIVLVLIVDGIKLGLAAPFSLWWTLTNWWCQRRATRSGQVVSGDVRVTALG
jgi:hypothetical protein